MKLLAAVLGSLIVLIQYPLWFGKGGWLRVWEVEQQLVADHQHNEALRLRNAALAAEVRDLKEGLDAIEERARYEQGMVKKDEIFFQIIEPQKRAPAR
ncbi:MAG: cell division protein FtsB [Betaproteobacteria bacterium]|jgi:cell division protein FtsB|nr:cell division protein FtsB [Betaproteobacteria bacterium]